MHYIHLAIFLLTVCALRVSKKIVNVNAVHNFKICSMALVNPKFVTRNHEYMLMRDFKLPPQCK